MIPIAPADMTQEVFTSKGFEVVKNKAGLFYAHHPDGLHFQVRLIPEVGWDRVPLTGTTKRSNSFTPSQIPSNFWLVMDLGFESLKHNPQIYQRAVEGLKRLELEGIQGISGSKVIVQDFGYRGSFLRMPGSYVVSGGSVSEEMFAHEHPAIFPEAVVRDHIISWSDEGDVVYDPFLGSGTTAKMALLHKRNWIGSEISEDYCRIIDRRLAETKKKMNAPQ